MATKQPRQQKTPKQRAEEALGIAERKVTKLAAEHRRLRDLVNATSKALDEARQIREYLAQHPALQAPAPSTPTTTPIQETGKP